MSNREMEPKLFVYIIKRSENEFELAGLSEDKIVWCILPEEYKNLQDHKILCTKTSIKGAISAIKPINGYRKIGVKIDKDLRKEYFDNDDNLCYKNIPLEECEVKTNYCNESDGNFLIKRIKELETKLNQKELQLHEVEKKFILDKFEKKHNPIEWLEQYETECTRHNMKSDTKRIEILRFFVGGPSKNWYESNMKKIGLENWLKWKKSFFTVFIDKGWSQIRKAYTYKHLGGSLIDYALAKERLCLEIESKGTEISRINMIVVGLPIRIQDELDREEITTIEKLFTELRKLDDKTKEQATINANINKKSEKIKEKSEEQKKKSYYDGNISKTPCFICESLGWTKRFHAAADCRNKNLYITKKQVNFNEVHDTDGEVTDSMNIKIDNQSLN